MKMQTLYEDPFNVTVKDLDFTLSAQAHFGKMTFWNYQGQISNFDAYEIRIHSPSEHTLNEKHTDVEMQIYHKDRYGKQGVLSIFFDDQQSKNAHSEVLEHFILDKNESQ